MDEKGEDGNPTESDGSDFFLWLTENQPQVSKLIEVSTDSYIKYKKCILESEEAVHQKQMDLKNSSLRDRQILTAIFILSVLIIFVIITWLTYTGNFDGTTLAFFLGTSVGSLLTILGKIFSPKE